MPASDHVLEALEALAELMAGLNPSPEPRPKAVSVYPLEHELPAVSELPFIIISHDIYRAADMIMKATQADGVHHWRADIDIFLAERVLPELEAEFRVRPWYDAVIDTLLRNPYLGGTVEHMGPTSAAPEDAIEMRTGHLHWYDQETREPKPYWGISVSVPVIQQFDYLEAFGDDDD